MNENENINATTTDNTIGDNNDTIGLYFTPKYIDKYNVRGKLTTTKGLLYITIFIFIGVLFFVSYMYISGKIRDAFDTTALVSMITVSGAIAGSNLCWYTKKSAAQRQYELRMALYHDSATVRLNYNESMMKLINKYKISEEELTHIQDTGNIDEMMEDAINDVVNNLNNNTSEAESTSFEPYNI